MKKKSNGASAASDELDIPPMTREEMRRGVMGKYYREVMAGSNLVRVAPDLSAAFPNEVAVNQALRELLQLRTLLRGIVSGPQQVKKRTSA